MFLTQYLQVKANRLCYNATISAAEQSARWRRAIDMLDIGVWSAIRLDVISFNAAMSACNSDGWKDALQVFKDLKARRLEVDVISFNSAISACEKSQRWRQALSLLEEALQTSLLFTTLAGIMAVSSGQFAIIHPGQSTTCHEKTMSIKSIQLLHRRYYLYFHHLQRLHQCLWRWWSLDLGIVAFLADDDARNRGLGVGHTDDFIIVTLWWVLCRRQIPFQMLRQTHDF